MIFLLASALSASLRADDGHQWTLRDSGTQQALNGLTGNGALFVAVGNAGTILTSPDAVTWSPQVSPSKQDLNGVAWFHGLFVAVGNHSLVMTSPDGKSWTPENLIITANLRSIAASAATLVAVGDGGTILLSTDGEKWSVPAVPRSLPTRSGRAMVATPRRNFFRIVSTPHGFIIPTRDEIMTSTQGLDWASTTIIPGSDPFASGPLPQGGAKTTNAPAPNASAATTPSRRGGPGVRGRNGGWGRLGAVSDLLNSVAQSDDLIVGVGDAGQIRTFPKGGSWSLLINPLGSDFTEKLNDVYWSGRHFIAVGGNGTILSSIDGAQWEKINSSTKETLVAVSGQPGLLVAVGANGTIMTNDDLPVVAQPKITPAGGLFTSRPEVTLNCPTPGVTMHYTLDNTEPTEGSNTYDKPFLLPKPGTLRVRAFKDGMDASLESSVLFQMPLLAKIIDSTGEVRVPYSSPNPVAYFVVKTSGALPAPAFQWQRKPAGGDKWINYDGLTDKGGAKTTILGYSLDLHQWVQTVLSSPKADAETSVLEVRYDPAMDRDHFRCIISSVAGEVVSPEAELAMFHPVPEALIKEPEAAFVEAGKPATFTVGINVGDPPPVFQWIMEPAGSPTAVRLTDNATYSGTHTNTLTVQKTDMKMNGDSFYCTFTNDFQNSAPAALTTETVALRVWAPPPLIVKQPESAGTAEGADVTFTVTVKVGAKLNFQWECLPSPKATWQPLTNGPHYTGVNDATLVVHDPSLALSGCKYRCVVDNGHGDDAQRETSAAVVLTVRE